MPLRGASSGCSTAAERASQTAPSAPPRRATLAAVATDELPLFPLHSVLFPGGTLRLRVFEPRYLDLVRRCTREGSCFGVCLLLDDASAPAAWGTRARIHDFFATAEGMLGIAATGEGRFRATRTRVRDNGLIVASIERHDEPPPQPLRAEHCLLAQLLERLHQCAGGAHARAAKACYDDAAWVGYRLAEALPFSVRERQSLLQGGDAHARLDHIARLLPRFQHE